MVIQRTIDNLKDKPHEEKKVVAGGIAIAVVVVLLVGWAFFFLRSIQKGEVVPTLQGGSVPEDQLNAQFIQNTQRQLNDYYQQSADQFRALREQETGGGSVTPGMGVSPDQGTSDFGAQNQDF
jgi:hypothetical protein